MIQTALRQVTGDPYIVDHHLRHSFATNLLLMLSAKGNSDPLWRLFAKPPALLLEVATGLRGRLGLHQTTERSILWVVSSLLGHADPKTTLASYVHNLDWLIECETRSVGDIERYAGLCRSIKLDAVLLHTSESAARVWRQSEQDKTGLGPLLHRWGRHRNPLVMRRRRKPIVLPRSRLGSVTLPELPSPGKFDRVSRVPGSRFADQALCRLLPIPERALSGLRAALLIVNHRLQNGPRRTQRHAEAIAIRPNHLRPIPYPRLRTDIEDMEQFWTIFEQDHGIRKLWQNAVRGPRQAGIACEKRPAAGTLLEAASRAFLAASVKNSHALSFCGGEPCGVDGARALIAFLSCYYPPECIEVELRLRRGQSESAALQSLRHSIGHAALRYVSVRNVSRRQLMDGWKYGSLRISVLSRNAKNVKSYGAWYALYSCCIFNEMLTHMRGRPVGLLDQLPLPL